MPFHRERSAHLEFHSFRAIAVVPMLCGIPLACCLIMVATTRFADLMALGMTLNVNNRSQDVGHIDVPWTPQFTPDFTITE